MSARRLDGSIEAIADGLPTSGLKARLTDLFAGDATEIAQTRASCAAGVMPCKQQHWLGGGRCFEFDQRRWLKLDL